MKLFLIPLIALSITIQAQKPWQIHIIDNSSSGADGVKMADINYDGRLDIVTGWEEGGDTRLYLQPELNLIQEKWPVIILGKTPDIEDAVFADMNNDGKLDVVSCTENVTRKIFIHWNPGNDISDHSKWKQDVLPVSDGLMMWMYAEPLQVDQRNGIDLIAAGKNKNAALGWFEAPEKAGNLNDWRWHQISPVGWVMSILKKDMDNDGDTDIIISDRRGNLRGCRWLENPGTGETQRKPWLNHDIGVQNLEAMFMCLTDLNGDGLEDAVVAEKTGNTIRICTRLDKNGNQWKERSIQIPELTGDAKSVCVGDINMDGYYDFIVSTETGDQVKNGLIWLNGKSLTESGMGEWQNISDKHISKYDKVELIDMDKDGDQDVLICEENFGENSKGLGVVWYENPYK
jgi:hypothetical protein